MIDGPDVFFSHRFVVYTTLTWSDLSAGFHARVISDTIGPVVRSVAGDPNGDNKKEIVVTNQSGEGLNYFTVQFEREEWGHFDVPENQSAGVFVSLPSFNKPFCLRIGVFAPKRSS